MANMQKAALLTEWKKSHSTTAKKEGTSLNNYSWSRIKNEKKNEKMNDMPDLSLRFKEAYLPLQVPAVQGKPIHHRVRQPWKNFQDKYPKRKGEIEESSSGNLKIKIFPRSIT